MDFLKDIVDTNISDLNIFKEKPLNIKFGIDPTSDFIHLGHVYLLNKLKEFSYLGHSIQIVLGDFTASVGDPSGKDTTRPMLNKHTIIENCIKIKTYLEHYFKDTKNVTIYLNSSFYTKHTFNDVLSIFSHVSLNQLLHRPDFKNRLTNNSPITLSEVMYPVLQGLDSVYLVSDLEIGGSDQLFNLQMGSKLQKIYRLNSLQNYMTFPILPGIDNTERKMSKSYNNTISNKDTPSEIFYKVLNLPDDKLPYFQWILDTPIPEESINIYKEQLALKTVGLFYPTEEVDKLSLKVLDVYVDLNQEQVKVFELIPQIQPQLFKEHSFSKLIKQKSVKYKNTPLDFNTVFNIQDFPIHLELTKKLKVILNYKQNN